MAELDRQAWFAPPAADDEEPSFPGGYAERRAAPRMPLRHIDLWVDGVAYPGRGDISEGGSLWKGPGWPPVADRVEVAFRVPGTAGAVRLAAEVLHTADAGGLLGVHMRFGRVPAAIVEAIRAYRDEWFQIADASGLVDLGA